MENAEPLRDRLERSARHRSNVDRIGKKRSKLRKIKAGRAFGDESAIREVDPAGCNAAGCVGFLHLARVPVVLITHEQNARRS